MRYPRHSKKDRVSVIGIVSCSAISLGITARFWRAVLTPPLPLTIDWTPAVYWVLGIVFATIALQWTLKIRDGLPPNGKALLLALNALCLTGYLGMAAVLVYKSFAAIPA